MARERRPTRLDPSEAGWLSKHRYCDQIAEWHLRGRLCMADGCLAKATYAVAVRTASTGRTHEVGVCRRHLVGLGRKPPTVIVTSGFTAVARRRLGADEIIDGPVGSDEGG